MNTATIEPDGLNGPLPSVSASVRTPVNRSNADVEVSLTGPVTATAGTNIVHTITVQNNGPSAASDVSLFDPIPPGLTQVSVTGACTSLPCSLGSMANADVRTVAVTYAVPVDYSGPDPIVNRATVTTAAEDIFPNNNTASASTALRASVADLAITNTNGVSSVVAGTTTTYTITVTNAGPSAATDAVVTDVFPSALTGVSWSCAGTGGAVCGAAAGTGNIDATVTVPVTGAATFTATGTVTTASGDTLENTARVVPAAGTSDPTQAIATDIDPIEVRADLSVTTTGPATRRGRQPHHLHPHCAQRRASRGRRTCCSSCRPCGADLRVRDRPLHGLSVQPRDACGGRDRQRTGHVRGARHLPP